MQNTYRGSDAYAQLAGKNRLELLLFSLQGKQAYATNVFKVREVIHCPKLTRTPGRHSAVIGVAHVRGHKSLAVIDIDLMLHNKPLTNPEEGVLIITEYNQNVQGFLVKSVNRIINTSWDKIESPAGGLGSNHYLTAVTRFQSDEIIEIIDIEKILAEIIPPNVTIDEEILEEEGLADKAKRFTVFMVDDSSVARQHLHRILTQVGVNINVAKDGAEAYEMLYKISRENKNFKEDYLALITDAEMPNMDGYTLTKRCREDQYLKDLHIVLNTSISGVFNQEMANRVGCDAFVPKTSPNEVATLLIDLIHKRLGEDIPKRDHLAPALKS
ncbi:chemotaxis protein [Piscirickettsia salmonis]|uniref:chemotaxis protein n=1 Tax=Piscirickettsia salmonis TaxID=1238 RepID=UPI003A7FD549